MIPLLTSILKLIPFGMAGRLVLIIAGVWYISSLGLV